MLKIPALRYSTLQLRTFASAFDTEGKTDLSSHEAKGSIHSVCNPGGFHKSQSITESRGINESNIQAPSLLYKLLSQHLGCVHLQRLLLCSAHPAHV